MEKLAEDIEKLIKNTAQEAIVSSSTYVEAINKVTKFSRHKVYDLVIKKAIQDEITAHALNSKINKGETIHDTIKRNNK